MPVPLSDAISSFKQQQERDQIQEQRPERLEPPPQRPEPRQEHHQGFQERKEYPEERWPKESREAARGAGYPDRSTYDAPATRRCFDLGNKVPKCVTKDYPGYKVPSHYSCSVETNAKLEQQSVSSGRRTPTSADRLISNSGDGDFVSGSQSSVNTPPLHYMPPIASRGRWAAKGDGRWAKLKFTQGMTDAHHMESEQPEVVDNDLLLAATRKIEAAAREHPGWSAVAERKDSQKHVLDKVDRNESGGYALQEIRRERVSAGAPRGPTAVSSVRLRASPPADAPQAPRESPQAPRAGAC